MEPAARALVCRRLAVQRIEANPVSAVMRISNQIRETLFFLSIPFACGGLSCGFDDAPWIVPPPVIVVGWLRCEACCRSRAVLVVCRRCAEDQKRNADSQFVMKRLLLCVRFTCQNKERLYIQWSNDANFLRARCGRDPVLILAKETPDCPEMFRFLSLEIQIQRDQWPIATVALFQGGLDDRPYAFEEVVSQRRLRSSRRRTMRKDRPFPARPRIFVPCEILFNCKRRARG